MSTSAARARLIVAALLLPFLGALADCSSGRPLADRSLPAVRTEETRIEALLAAGDPSAQILPSGCRVRLLRQEGTTSWAWTICEVTASTVGEAFAGPVRVDGDRLWMPSDAAYLADVNARFPADLVDVAVGGNNQFVVELGLKVGQPLPTPLPTPRT
ncbi:hypothetical protein [Lapillicoccus sp.]|uniref:hypothetical protein n=1 Tax=Lapillicoccus sp. TaxID=1909287 RepID=UPI0025E903AD|nr:hypothetical protein [Lapillicoccus sp.]